MSPILLYIRFIRGKEIFFNFRSLLTFILKQTLLQQWMCELTTDRQAGQLVNIW